MDEENRKNEVQATTSRQDSHRSNSAEELYNREGDEPMTNSNYSDSATYSKQSRVDVADARIDAPKLHAGRKETKTPQRKRRTRRVNGRIEKRRRSYTRRPVRKAQRKYRAREYRPRTAERRIMSMSSILSDLPSRTGAHKCLYCGHRCCRRWANQWSGRQRMKQTKFKRYRRLGRKRRAGRKPVKMRLVKNVSVQNQVGAPCLTLSPLFVKTNLTLDEEVMDTGRPDFREITPEIIYESLDYLSKWRAAVESSYLMEHIARNYSVNPDQNELLKELKQKLIIASLAGIATELDTDRWCLATPLFDRGLTHHHVSLFWIIYADTMKPIEKKEIQRQKEAVLEEERGCPTA